ncbi:hypothetical protein L345_16358, partial [Ophiophagus hannah]
METNCRANSLIARQPDCCIPKLEEMTIGEYYMKNYTSALKSFTEGQTQDSADSTFPVWIKKCEEALSVPGAQAEMAWPSKIKYDWYQTDSHVIVTIMVKNVKQVDVNITFSEKESQSKVYLKFFQPRQVRKRTYHDITTKISQIEIKMKKPEAVRWDKLEGQEKPDIKKDTPASNPTHDYPSSSHYTKNWDKLVVEIKEEEKNEKLEGDAALNKLFQQIYSDGTDEVKRAMNKSFDLRDNA